MRHFSLPIEGWTADDGDEEMGILPLLAAALPAVASIAGPLVGDLLGGGGGKPAPAAAPAAAGNPAAAISSLLSGAKLDPDSFKGMVREIVSTVSPPVRQQVSDAVREQLNTIRAGNADLSKVMENIVAQIGPLLKSQMSEVNKAALQRQATYEHETLKRQEARWKANADAQRAILQRLNEVETKVGQAVVRGNAAARRVAAAYGVPKRVV